MDLMPAEDKGAILLLNRPEIQRPFVSLTTQGGDGAMQGCSRGQVQAGATATAAREKEAKEGKREGGQRRENA